MFSITINKLTNTSGQYPNAAAIIKTYFDLIAKELASRLVCAPTGNIEINVAIETTLDGGAVASAVGNSTSFGDLQNPEAFSPREVPMQEVIAGVDCNGGIFDGLLNMSLDLLRLADSNKNRAAAASSPDAVLMASAAYSTFMHEMLHVLGFSGNDDANTGAGAKADGTSWFIYDNWSTIIDGKPYFTGPTATAIYGAAIPLSPLGNPGSSLYHFSPLSPSDGSVITVLQNDMMQPTGNDDYPTQISNLDLAVLADLGYTVRDTLTSVDGHTFVPGQGAQAVAGTAASNDKVAYMSAQSSFTIERSGVTTTVASMSNSTNVATLSGIESLSFADGTIALDYNDVVQSLYIAYFGRPADKGGLANFQNALRSMGAPKDLAGLEATYGTNAGIKELVDSFASSAESKALYGTGTTNDFVTQIYMNVLGRAPNAGGLAYWAGEIDQGHLGRPKAALSIMAGAQSNTTAQGQLDGKLVLNRIGAGSNFTLAIDTAVEMNAYRGDAAAAAARAMLATVQSKTDTHLFQATVTATLEGLVSKATSTVASNTLTPLEGNEIELIGQIDWHPIGLLA